MARPRINGNGEVVVSLKIVLAVIGFLLTVALASLATACTAGGYRRQVDVNTEAIGAISEDLSALKVGQAKILVRIDQTMQR